MKRWEEDDLFYSLLAPTFWTTEIDLFVSLILGGGSCAPRWLVLNQGHPSDWYCCWGIDISRTKKRCGMRWLRLDVVDELQWRKARESCDLDSPNIPVLSENLIQLIN